MISKSTGMMKSSHIRAKINKTNCWYSALYVNRGRSTLAKITQSEHRRKNNSTLVLKAWNIKDAPISMTRTANKYDEQEVMCLTLNHSVKLNLFVLKASQRVGTRHFGGVSNIVVRKIKKNSIRNLFIWKSRPLDGILISVYSGIQCSSP